MHNVQLIKHMNNYKCKTVLTVFVFCAMNKTFREKKIV